MNRSRINSYLQSPLNPHWTRAKHWPYRRLAWQASVDAQHGICWRHVCSWISSFRLLLEAHTLEDTTRGIFSLLAEFTSSICEFVEPLRVFRVTPSLPSQQRVFHEYPAWRLTRPDSQVLASLGRVVLHWIKALVTLLVYDDVLLE